MLQMRQKELIDKQLVSPIINVEQSAAVEASLDETESSQQQSSTFEYSGVISTYPQVFKGIMLNCRGPFGIQLVKGAIPFMYSMILSHLSLNTDIKAAGTLINTYDDFVYSVFNAPLYFISTAVGELNNESNESKIGQTVQAGWLMAICVATPQVILLVSSETILEWCNQTPEVAALVGEFFQIASIAYPFFSMQIVLDKMALTTGHKYLPVISQIIGLSGGLLSTYPVIYGKWGAPDLNFMGISWFFAARASINFFVFLGYLAISNKIGISNKRWGSFAPYNLFKFKKEGFFSILKMLCKKGLPLSLIYASETGSSYLINMFIGVLGKNQLAAQLVISQYQSLLLIFISTCAESAQITISNTLGTNDKRNIIKYGNVSIALSLIFPVIYVILTLVIPNILIRPFINSGDQNYEEIEKILDQNKLLFIGGINLIINSIRIVSTLSLIGAGITGSRLIANMLLAWLGVGLGYALAFPANCGIDGLALGFGSGLLISATAQGMYWRDISRGIFSQRLQETDLEMSLLKTSSSTELDDRRNASTRSNSFFCRPEDKSVSIACKEEIDERDLKNSEEVTEQHKKNNPGEKVRIAL